MDAIVNFVMGLIQLAIFVVIVLGIVAIWGYNTLRKLAENVKEAESNIDVALRKKVSLVNQLIDVAGKYMDRESLVMLKVSQDSSAAAAPQLYQQSGTVLSTIQGMAQKFPDLQSSQQYSNLAAAITQCEGEVQTFRIRSNSAIKEYNSKRSALPHALYAGFLGFRPARYLELETVESADSSIQKQIISDDGDRVNELLGMAGTRVIDATKNLTGQGKLLVEKAAARVQTEIAARSAAAAAAATAPALAVEYQYFDSNKGPTGPVSRAELDALFRSGSITADTLVLEIGTQSWMKYQNLGGPSQ